MAAVYLDVSKAYECVDHAARAEVLEYKSPPGVAWMAILAYRGPRRVAYANVASPEAATPSRGIIAGCGIAVALTGGYTTPTLLAGREAGAHQARGYVDDLVASVRGAQGAVGFVLQQVVTAMVDQLNSRGLAAHPTKFVLLATAAAGRA